MVSEKVHVARSAVTAGLALAFGVSGLVGPASVALAATGGTVTIAKTLGDEATTGYDVYQVVTADVTQSGDNVDKGKRFNWAEGMKDIVVPFLNEWGYADWLVAKGYVNDVDSIPPAQQPQNAVEFISEMIQSSNNAANTSTTPPTKQGGSFANEFAQCLAQSANPIAENVSSLADAEQGYYLFVTNKDTIDDANATQPVTEVGTAPIWATVKVDTEGNPVDYTVTEKTNKPTLVKEVLDENGQPVKVVDLATDQIVTFKTTSGLPSNFDAYDSFHLKLDDPVPTGLSLDLDNDGNPDLIDNVKVEVGEGDEAVDITEYATISVDPDTGNLIVDIPDLKQVPGVDGQKPIIVTYDERVTDANPLGKDGALSGITMTYTGDPTSNKDVTIETNGETRVVNYELQVTKVDESTRNALENAKFTLKVLDNANGDLVDLYVGENGALSDTAYEFTSNGDGILEIPHIDEGTYLLEETEAPSGYDKIDSPVTITIVADKNDTSVALTDIKVTLSGGNKTPDGADTMGAHDADSHDSVADHLDGYVSADIDTGVIAIRLSDAKRIELPGTGLTPSNIMMIGGAIMMAVGAVVVIRQRKSNSVA